jgi:hypothetical protein
MIKKKVLIKMDKRLLDALFRVSASSGMTVSDIIEGHLRELYPLPSRKKKGTAEKPDGVMELLASSHIQ